MSTLTTNEPAQERFRGLIPVLSTMKALIVGCGSLGSHLTAMLARMKPAEINIVDHDVVGPENIGVQNYEPTDIGLKKTSTLFAKVKNHVLIRGHPISFKKYAEYHLADEAQVNEFSHVFMCVDTMATRAEIWNKLYERKWSGILIDGRLDANTGWIYAGKTKWSSKWYPSTRYSDLEVIKVANRCAIQMTGYSAHVVAGLMVAQAMRHSQETLEPEKCGIDLNNMLFFPVEC